MQVIWLIGALFLQAADAPATPSASAPSSVAVATQPGPLNSAQQVAPAIQTSIRTNSERLEGAELSLTRTLINSDVKEETRIEEPLPNGGRIVTTKRPQQTSKERVVLKDDRLRVDLGGVGSEPSITEWFDGVRWTESNTRSRRVSKRYPNQIGSRVLDPREAAGLDYRTSLATILSQPALKDATLETVGTLTRIATTTGEGGQKLVVDFDAKHAMLPTHSQLFHPNGTIARDAAITYAWMEPRSAWAIKAITERIYEDTVDGLATPDRWKQQLITMATCTLLDPATTEKLLAPVVTEGYQVIDYTDPATLEQRLPPRKPTLLATAESPLKWLILAHVVFAAGAAVYVWRRRSASAV